MDTRQEHSLSCYCDECADSATDWYCWKVLIHNVWVLVEGSRYWTIADAVASRVEGATLFHYTNDNKVIKCLQV